MLNIQDRKSVLNNNVMEPYVQTSKTKLKRRYLLIKEFDDIHKWYILFGTFATFWFQTLTIDLAGNLDRNCKVVPCYLLHSFVLLNWYWYMSSLEHSPELTCCLGN